MTNSPELAVKIRQKFKLQIKIPLSSLQCVFYRFSLDFSLASFKKIKSWMVSSRRCECCYFPGNGWL